MKWTRRNFMGMVTAAAGAIGIGGIQVSRALEGRVWFDDWRALPGMKMTLHIDVQNPEATEVALVTSIAGNKKTIESFHGASEIEFRVPYVKTDEESFEICAVVTDNTGRHCESEPLEVLADSFKFGM